ncbi:hypothetical protein D9M71_414690 [compost metagenome]
MLHARITFEQGREAAQFIEQGKADGADDCAGVIQDRQAHHHQRLFGRVEHVEQDRPAGIYHLTHQAARDNAFAGLADGTAGIAQAEAARIALIHPDDAGIVVDDQRAFARLLDDLEQRTNRQLPHLLVILEAVAVVHWPFPGR